MLAAVGAHLLGDTVEQAGADGAGGFGGDIAEGEARATGGDDEGVRLSGFAERGFDGGLVVRDNLLAGDLETVVPEKDRDGGAGLVFALVAEAAVADGEDEG